MSVDKLNIQNGIINNLIYDSFELNYIEKLKSEKNIDNHVLQDLNINSIIKIFEKNCLTSFGKCRIKSIIENPTHNGEILKNRINLLRIFNKIPEKMEIANILKYLGNNEDSLFWYFNNDDEINEIDQMFYFNNPYLNIINNNDFLLTCINFYKIFISPLSTIISPLLSIIIPFIFLKFFKINVPFGFLIKSMGLFSLSDPFFGSLFGKKAIFFTLFMKAIYAFLYIQGAYNSVIQSYNCNRNIKLLKSKIDVICKYVISINSLNNLCQNFINDENNTCKFESSFYELNLNKFDELIHCYDMNDYLCKNYGKILKIHNYFRANKNIFFNCLEIISELDALYSIRKTIEDYNLKKINIVKSDKPYLFINKMKHPLLNETQIKNNFNNDNMLITGPNKSGKSTYIKNIGINLIFAHSIGYSFVNSIKLTLFKKIETYLNIPDYIGKESLFEAEMYRARNFLNDIKKRDDKTNYFSFIIMDEIFTSTNYPEGFAASYCLIKELISYKNCKSLITTHYTNLHKLSDEENINNYKFEAKISDSNSDSTNEGNDGDNNKIIEYNYQLQDGWSEQFIALELLKKEGFNLDDAINIKNDIIKKLRFN